MTTEKRVCHGTGTRRWSSGPGGRTQSVRPPTHPDIVTPPETAHRCDHRLRHRSDPAPPSPWCPRPPLLCCGGLAVRAPRASWREPRCPRESVSVPPAPPRSLPRPPRVPWQARAQGRRLKEETLQRNQGNARRGGDSQRRQRAPARPGRRGRRRGAARAAPSTCPPRLGLRCAGPESTGSETTGPGGDGPPPGSPSRALPPARHRRLRRQTSPRGDNGGSKCPNSRARPEDTLEP